MCAGETRAPSSPVFGSLPRRFAARNVLPVSNIHRTSPSTQIKKIPKSLQFLTPRPPPPSFSTTSAASPLRPSFSALRSLAPFSLSLSLRLPPPTATQHGPAAAPAGAALPDTAWPGVRLGCLQVTPRRRCGARKLAQPDLDLVLGAGCPGPFGDGWSCWLLAGSCSHRLSLQRNSLDVVPPLLVELDLFHPLLLVRPQVLLPPRQRLAPAAPDLVEDCWKQQLMLERRWGRTPAAPPSVSTVLLHCLSLRFVFSPCSSHDLSGSYGWPCCGDVWHYSYVFMLSQATAATIGGPLPVFHCSSSVLCVFPISPL
jgi:hypothetical protein